MRLHITLHAARRMLEWRVRSAAIEHVLRAGEIIEDYPDDTPYPSRLVLGRFEGRYLHVVAADVPGTDDVVIITVYEPDPNVWDVAFRMRRPT